MAPTTWLEQPLTRLRAILEGSYPATHGSDDRWVTSGTFRSTRLHGDLAHPEFPAQHLHRGYDLVVQSSGFVRGQSANNTRGGRCDRRAVVMLRFGYLFGRDHPQAHSAGVTPLGVASELGHADHELVEWPLTWPGNRGGLDPTLYAINPIGDADLVVLDPLGRCLVQRPYELLASYVPGRRWA